MFVLLRHLWERPECERALDLAHVVLQDGVRRERLGQVEAVLYLERLADGPLLGARAHGAGRDPFGVANVDRRRAHVAHDPLLPQVELDGGQGAARHPGVQERVGHVEHGPLDVGHLVAVVAADPGQRALADLGQLGLGEPDEGVAALVPEAVALAEVPELDPDDAGERGADEAAVQGRLGEAT